MIYSRQRNRPTGTVRAGFDHLLMVGFGGPTRPEEIRPFLAEVTRGAPIPPARLENVLHHYEAVGGRSRYNEDTERLVRALELLLRARGIHHPVFMGMRNWHPFLKDVMATIRQRGLRRGLGVILAPHRSDASFDKYIRNVEEAKAHASATAIEYEYLGPWYDHSGFIEAQADEVGKVLQALSPVERERVHLLFCAHSIPAAMAQQCGYAQEFETSSHAVAERLEHRGWSLAYQSRSGTPQEPWLEPDVESVIRQLPDRGARHVVVVPIGFLCEHVEVLFDLDIEARQEAQRAGLGYHRASTVLDHPSFVEMFAQLIEGQMAGYARREMRGRRD